MMYVQQILKWTKNFQKLQSLPRVIDLNNIMQWISPEQDYLDQVFLWKYSEPEKKTIFKFNSWKAG